ncbi:MAG: phosphate--acyl-ACP acyltransferase, partial [Oscillospiraceae bacterium]|nr:phosphate--acyl-ACP acyltransferase [Oscillospiraceae bacterium]
MRIIVDAMGGDFAPGAAVEGALMAVKAFGVDVTLVGREAEILAVLAKQGHKVPPKGIEIVDTA